MFKTKLWGFLLVSLFLFLSSYLVIDLVRADDSGLKIPKFDPDKYSLLTPTLQDISQTINLAGSISADKIASVKFQTSGQLAWVGVKLGDRVKKGQALASLDKAELTKRFQKEANDYLTNRSSFEDTQDEYKPTKDKHLLTDDIRRILDRQQYSLNNAVLDYELADLAVKYATIYSPIQGIVVAIDEPNPGVNITPATATITVIDPSSIYFDTEIDEEDVVSLKLNQPAQIKLDSFPDLSIDSQIDYIAFTPKTGQSSTVYQVKLNLDLDNQDLTYRLGMSGDCQIILDIATNSLTVPIEAITENNNSSYVLVKNGSQLSYQKVVTGLESDTHIAVISGLSATDQIVIAK